MIQSNTATIEPDNQEPEEGWDDIEMESAFVQLQYEDDKILQTSYSY